MVRVPFHNFFLYNVIGAVAWITSMVMLGHWLGNLFPDIINYIEYIIVLLVVVTAIPVIITYRKNSRMTDNNANGSQVN
jgi:membrane-associated protein